VPSRNQPGSRWNSDDSSAIDLDAARREFLEGQAVGLAQCAQLAAEEVRVARVLGHAIRSCEINVVKFPR
jgi:hypothetical protein